MDESNLQAQESNSQVSSESNLQFETRKSDHIEISLDPRSQTEGLSLLDRIHILPEALPDFNFSDVSIETTELGQSLSAPFFVSSMTAGHKNSLQINQKLASFCEHQRILMGVGSQRRELTDLEASNEWKKVRQSSPKVMMIGNLGIAQLIEHGAESVQRLADQIEAVGFFIHLNALQECLQKEGTPNFKGSWKALEELCAKLDVPVLVKEVGCGFSESTLKRLNSVGVYAVDVAGLGGTHWGRVETLRFSPQDENHLVGQAFKNWGLSTTESLLNGKPANVEYKLWASGGLRTGVEIFKVLSLGASMAGLAQPWMKAIQTENGLEEVYSRLVKELKIAMFCSGTKTLREITAEKVRLK